ncbi:MAG: dinB [Fibrobacteres bacterium]|nr:dinB [Fibrobacterota bacterium]
MPASSPQPLFLALEAGDFMAQAIAAWDGRYKDKAFAVIDQDPGSHKTFLLSCSPAAAALGARAGMPLSLVRRRFRGVTPVFRNPAWEASLGEELRALCRRYTPEFDVRGGRALLDMTGTPAARALQPEALAAKLRRDALYSSGLQYAAVGAAATRLMAKVMARMATEDGEDTAWCPAGEEEDTLDPLAPECLPGLSPQCRERIRRYSLKSVGQIRGLGRQALASRFGGEGEKLYTLACGMDLEEVRIVHRGIAAETSLEEDVNDNDELDRKVRLTADKLVFHLRKAGLQADKLILSLRYADGKTARKTAVVRPRTDEFRILADKAREMFRVLYQRRVALRSISLAAPAPKQDTGQTDLFESQGDRRQKALGDALAKIRGRSGFGAILSGANVEPE